MKRFSFIATLSFDIETFLLSFGNVDVTTTHPSQQYSIIGIPNKMRAGGGTAVQTKRKWPFRGQIFFERIYQISFFFHTKVNFFVSFRFLISTIGYLHFELVQLRSFQSFFIKYISNFIVYRKKVTVLPILKKFIVMYKNWT